MTSSYSNVVDAAIFEHLQAKIDEDAEVREQLKGILQDLEKQGTFLGLSCRDVPVTAWAKLVQVDTRSPCLPKYILPKRASVSDETPLIDSSLMLRQ
jgi:hypothetical protein